MMGSSMSMFMLFSCFRIYWLCYCVIWNLVFHLGLLYQVRVFYVSFSVIISGSCVLFHLVLLYQVRVFCFI